MQHNRKMSGAVSWYWVGVYQTRGASVYSPGGERRLLELVIARILAQKVRIYVDHVTA